MLLCDVNFKEIPASTRFGHPYGITIWEGVKLGENCNILSNVTIGRRRIESERRAVIGNNVEIGTGAIILGPVRIGDNAIIAAGAIVLNDVPANTTYISRINT